MITLLFFIMLRSTNVFSFEFSENWTRDFIPEVRVTCENHEAFCRELCDNDETCSQKLKVCRDCIGTSMQMMQLFERMGISFRNSGSRVSEYEFQEFLKQEEFVVFSSKSIYNQVDSFDSPALRARFQSLCPKPILYPVVFFGLNPRSYTLSKARYVACGSEIFEMSNTPMVDVNTLLPFLFLD